MSNKPGRKLGITWGNYVGLPECPYMRRWVLNLGKFSIRLHHWYASDDSRNLHDHPFNFLTFVFWGGYTDVTENGRQRMKAPAIAYRPATHKHTVEVDKGGAWTLLITGPEIREWGFWVNGKFKRAYRYFFDHKHWPCED